MIRLPLARLARMDRAEINWRIRTTTRTMYQRVRSSLAAPAWDRRDLLSSLARTPELDTIRTALRDRRWDDAHALLSGRFATRPMRFVIAPCLQSTVRQRVRREFPDSPHDAAARADRVLAGEYDLLGYVGLRFDRAAQLSNTEVTEDAEGKSLSVRDPFPRALRVHRGGAFLHAAIDWHLDPVHGRRVPRMFWADVPYLDPASGDHKIIWELNRHQHWLRLGRAFWLTGDSRYRRRFVWELESWLESNPPLTGVNWASMLELALRSLSWIWALHFFADDAADRPADRAADRRGDGAVPWTVDLLLGIDRQLTHVEHNLSHYFSPNTHLLGEALALYVAGRALPELARSPRREAIGRRILIAEIARQISGDGGHCERSMHYHRYALDFYLLALAIARITDDPIAPVFERATGRLAAAARLLADADGRAAHIGDDDGGMLVPIAGRAVDDWRDSLASAAALLAQPDLRVGPTPEEPFWLLAHPALASALDASRRAPVAGAVPSAALPDTGYFVSRSPAGDHLIADGGPHGYRNAGHAHADALSLTFTLRGLPLLIDPGTACYTIDPDLRDRMRSTPLHNTLVLDQRSQSTPRGPFHWSTTADSTVRRWRVNGGFDYFDGAHDGYRPSVHRRHMLALHGDLLLVADLVTDADSRCDDQHEAAVHWHIDPRWRVETHGYGAHVSAGGERASLHAPEGLVEAFCGDERSGLGWHAPVYGRIEPATTIRVTRRGRAPLWIVSVFGLDPDNAVEAVETLPVWAEASVIAHSTSVRITRRSSVDYLLIVDPSADNAGGHTGPPLQAIRAGAGLRVGPPPSDVGADLRVGPPPSDVGADLRVGPARRTWRVADLETDARMLFCRIADQRITRIALVDGSLVRSSLRHGVQLALPHVVSDLHVDSHGIGSDRLTS
jgi:hypothetical protein